MEIMISCIHLLFQLQQEDSNWGIYWHPLFVPAFYVIVYTIYRNCIFGSI